MDDDLTCSLSQIVHLCNETNIFLYQLYKFESQFEKFNLLSRKNFVILKRFSIILNDLNIYYENYFLKYYKNIFNYLSRKSFTINYSNEIINDLNHLNYFLKHKKTYYQKIFYYLHKLSITCLICIQYRQIYKDSQFVNRLISIRIDLLENFKKLNNEIKILLIKINFNFKQKTKEFSIKKIHIKNLFQTIFRWLFICIIGYYFFWPFIYETKSNNGYPM